MTPVPSALDALLARYEEAERERRAAEEWARTMEHERDYAALASTDRRTP